MPDESTAPDPDFQDLVEAWYSPLYRFAYSLAGNEFEAADLTQDTFLIWARKGESLRDPAKSKSWLFTTLYREFLRQRKRGSRITPQEPDVLSAISPTIPPNQIRELDASLAVDALAEIDPIFREPITLFYLEDFSYKEIAETLDLPIGTVMSRLSRGKEQLKSVLLKNHGIISPE